MKQAKRLRLDRVPSLKEYENIVRRLRYEAIRKPDIEKVLPLTVAVTGARISELLKLTTADIDFEEPAFYVVTLKKPGNPKRRIPLPLWYITILQSYIVRNGIGFKVFPISRQMAWYIVKRETGYHPHAFRHAFGMYMLYKGVDPETVKRILGHSDWELVEEYVKTVKIDLGRDKNPLNDLMY